MCFGCLVTSFTPRCVFLDRKNAFSRLLENSMIDLRERPQPTGARKSRRLIQLVSRYHEPRFQVLLFSLWTTNCSACFDRRLHAFFPPRRRPGPPHTASVLPQKCPHLVLPKPCSETRWQVSRSRTEAARTTVLHRRDELQLPARAAQTHWSVQPWTGTRHRTDAFRCRRCKLSWNC